MTLTLILLIPALLILLLCWCSRRFEAPEDQPLELRQPRFVQGAFLFGVLGFAILALIIPLVTDMPEAAPLLAGMALFTSLLAPFGFISCIRYGTGGMTIRTYFGRVHALRWEDVTLVQAGSYDSRSRQDGFIIADGRKFHVNYSMPGAEDFIRRAQQECRKRGVDTAPPRRNDVFHGNVHNAGAVLFGWWFFGIFLAFVGGMWAFFCLRNPESTADDWFMVPVCAVVLLWWILRCLRGIQVGRNPQKYGKKAFENHFGRGSWPGK